ncbi:Raffinose synthase [Corchorus olitorius]|uniref:galactinol--sucrose galactosyltransferase n=1 Tax=Corchorus olitorius TaxID=93759 RepID=A0A1R3KIT6_9ROSI|nr:Raffinose synthase [Corchorus olitorius]
MSVGAGICLSDGKLTVFGNSILHHVHHNVVITPASTDNANANGAFIGVTSDHKGSTRLFPLGKLEGLRFMCVFRYKFWWMTQLMGASGKDIPFETQFLVVEVPHHPHLHDKSRDDEAPQSVIYAVFLPIIEGDFRAVLQGNDQNEIEICLESGDPGVDKFEGSHLVFVSAGTDPYDVITNSVKTVEKHLQTFSHREEKKMPDILNWFGWCTWDAFYTNVTAEGLKQGLESLDKGGTPPKFVIIDDGWQSVGMDPTGIEYRSDYTANFAERLIHIKENHKFQKDGKEGHRVDDPGLGLGYVVSEMKERHNLKYVYVWHAITGYWGGVKPGLVEMEPYEPKLQYPIPSPGVQSNEYCQVLQSITRNGVGLVNPEKVSDFYNDLHSYLASAGIDGVKVDAQSILETLGAGHGGRGAGWCGVRKRMVSHEEQPGAGAGIISGVIRARDVEYLRQVAVAVAEDGCTWTGDTILYSHRAGEVAYLPTNASVSVTLKPREYEVYTVVPVKVALNGAKFAPIGLIKMFNSGGAIKELKYDDQGTSIRISMKVQGCGVFGAYSSTQPQRTLVDSQQAEFEYDGGSGLLTIGLPVPQSELYLWNIVIQL